MRISDWSSDVCSSDLQREVPTMSDVHDDEEGVDYAAELERPRQPGSDVEVMLRRLHDVVGSARPMPLSTSVMINRDEVLDALDDRSEEHTSELQSLMRISYAVFCLKTKKKQQERTGKRTTQVRRYTIA